MFKLSNLFKRDKTVVPEDTEHSLDPDYLDRFLKDEEEEKGDPIPHVNKSRYQLQTKDLNRNPKIARERRRQARKMYQSVNPDTGKKWSVVEISQELKVSRARIYHYLGTLKRHQKPRKEK